MWMCVWGITALPASSNTRTQHTHTRTHKRTTGVNAFVTSYNAHSGSVRVGYAPRAGTHAHSCRPVSKSAWQRWSSSLDVQRTHTHARNFCTFTAKKQSKWIITQTHTDSFTRTYVYALRLCTHVHTGKYKSCCCCC